MSKRLEKLLRRVAKASNDLTRFERLIAWYYTLSGDSGSQPLIDILRSSGHAEDVALAARARAEGVAATRAAVLQEIRNIADRQSVDDAAPPILSQSALGREIFDWHDWPSFEMSLHAWEQTVA